eukprot:COSAG05_NODE_1114_length_5840_cov_2.676886_4_plen_55_part_00
MLPMLREVMECKDLGEIPQATVLQSDVELDCYLVARPTKQRHWKCESIFLWSDL